MPIILKDTGSNYVPPPEGTHLAICFRIVDVGVQPDSGFGEKHKLVVSWELPNEVMQTDQGPKPMGISKSYNYSLNAKSSLRGDLTRWRNREFTKEDLDGFQLNKILGKGCQLSIIHEQSKGKVKARIDGVFAVPKGMQVPAPVNKLVEYSIEQGKDETYKSLPEWIRGMVDEGLKRLAATPAPADSPAELPPEAVDDGGDVPF